MARIAQLADGTELEFPDDTTDEVMGRTVKKHLGVSSEKSLEQMDTVDRALSGVVGGPEALGSMITTGTTGIAAGVGRGLYGAATGGLEHGAEEFHKGLEAGTYEPRSAAGKYFTEGLGKGYEAVKEGVGMAGGYAPGADQAMGIDFSQPLNRPKDPSVYQFSEPARAATEAAFEGAVFGGPVHKVGTALKTRAATKAKEAADKYDQFLVEADTLAQKLEAEQAQALRDAPLPPYEPVPGESYLPEKHAYSIEKAAPAGVVDPNAAGPTQPTLFDMEGGLNTKPRLKGPPAVERDSFVTDRSAEYEAAADAAEAEHTARNEAMNARQTARIEAKERDRAMLRSFDDDVRGKSDFSRATQIADNVNPGGDAFQNKFYTHLEEQLGSDKLEGPVGVKASVGFKFIAENHSEGPYKDLAKRLDTMAGQTPVSLGSTFVPAAGGAFRHRTGTMQIGRDRVSSPYVWLHEGVHAALVAFQETRPNHPLNRALNALYIWALKTRHKQLGGAPDLVVSLDSSSYGFTNVREFVAEARTNGGFVDVLRTMRLTPEQARHIQNLVHDSNSMIRNAWDALKAIAAKILGYPKLDKSTMSLLDHVMDVSDRMFDEASKTLKQDLKELSKQDIAKSDNAPTFKDFKADLEARKIRIPEEAARAIFEGKKPQEQRSTSGLPAEKAIGVATNITGLEKIQRQYADRRSLDEIKTQLVTISKDTLMDKASRNTTDKILQGRFIAKDDPLLSYTSSNTHLIKQEAITTANSRMHGTSRHSPDPGTFNHMWLQLSKKSRIAVTDVVVAMRDVAEFLDDAGVQKLARETLKRELTTRELKSLRDRAVIMQRVITDVNEYIVAAGREPIHELPNYGFPSIFDGPFKVKFINAEGTTVKVHAFYRKPNQAKMDAIAKEAGPGHKAEILEDSGLRGDVDWEQFEWVLRQLDKELRDPAAKAITEGLRRQGFGARAMTRAGVLGAKGTEGGVMGLRGYEEVSEKYIRSAYDYIANRKLDQLFADVKGMDEANHLPFTKAYALEAIDVARGGSNKTMDNFSRMISAALSGLIEFGTEGKVVLPQRFSRDLLRYGNKVKTTLLLGFFHPVQIGAQFLQTPTFMPPKLMAMAVESGRNPALAFKAMGNALHELTKWNDSLDAQNLQKIGAFDATLQYDWSTYAGDNPRYKQALTDHLSGISTLMYLEAQAVRRPASLMFLAMLRELGYEKIARDKGEIYHVAKEMTDQYMVSNRFYEKPHAFSRTGLVGMAIGPLQNFSTTWLGMLREYTKLSAQGILDVRDVGRNAISPSEYKKAGFTREGGPDKSLSGAAAKQAPLIAFLGANLMTAGMLGIVGVKEWDWLANLYNKYTGSHVITGTEYIMSKFKSTGARYGLLSAALGVHVGATLNAPTLTGSFAPGVQAMGDAANIAWQGGKATGIMGEVNKPTQVEQRDAFKGVAPRFPLWGLIEKGFTPEGMPYQESSGNAGPYTRDKNDEMARNFGTYTNKEATAKGEFYAGQKAIQHRSVLLGKTMNRAVDIILTDPQASTKLPGLWKALGERGFSQQDIQQGLITEIKSRVTEADIRAMGKGRSTKQQQLIMLLQQLQGTRQ